jgi:hypothetical protein
MQWENHCPLLLPAQINGRGDVEDSLRLYLGVVRLLRTSISNSVISRYRYIEVDTWQPLGCMCHSSRSYPGRSVALTISYVTSRALAMTVNPTTH